MKRKPANPSKKETTNIFENNPWMKKMPIVIIRYYEKNGNETWYIKKIICFSKAMIEITVLKTVLKTQ